MQCCVSCLSKRKLDGSLQIQEFSYQQFSFQKFSHLEFSLQKFSNLEFSLQQLSNLQFICASNFLTCNEIVLPIFTLATKKFLQFTKVKFFQLSILQLISHPIFAHLIFPHPHKIPPIFMIPKQLSLCLKTPLQPTCQVVAALFCLLFRFPTKYIFSQLSLNACEVMFVFPKFPADVSRAQCQLCGLEHPM